MKILAPASDLKTISFVEKPYHFTVSAKLLLLVFLFGAVFFGGFAARGQVSYWVAPAAAGSGSGSSSGNAASYLNSSFWTTVQSQLSSSSVTVNFVSGSYTAGTLTFTSMGNPLNQLILSAVTPQGPVFQPNANPVIQFLGSQNIELNGMVITGPTTYWGVYCLQNGNQPTRNIEITNCWFLNLTNAYYAAIGLLNGVRSIQVLSCNFTNITAGAHQHIIYAPHDNEDILVSNCISQDCDADYMRFRDDTEYVRVLNSTFVSSNSASGYAFVSAEQYNETNSDAAGDEFFGTYFQISGNTFNYKASGGSGPYSAMHFYDDSWSPQSYYCDLTSAQATALGNGNQSYQQSFLATNMGLLGSQIKMFNNTYLGVSTYQMDYQYHRNDTTSPYNGWTGVVNLYNTPDTSGATMAPVPVLRNSDFNRRGLLETSLSGVSEDYQCLFRNWFASPEHTTVYLSTDIYGTNNALRFNTNDNQEVYQWITPPGTNWTMDCLFAIGSCMSGTGTKFKVDLFHNDITGGKVSVGVNSSGQFGIYNGGTFTTLPGLGTVAFSQDNTGDGTYTDGNDVLNVYRLRIVGNYSASTPYVNIYTSNANDTNLDNQVTNLTDWVSGGPVSGQSSPETVAFYNFTAPVLVGQIAITNVLLLPSYPPVIVSQIPWPNGAINLYPGDTPSFSILATGATPLNFQWFSNNMAVAGVTNTFTPASIPTNGTTLFDCIVTNFAGSTTSLVWSVTTVSAPTAAYPQAILGLNPIAYWPLNEAEQGGGDNGVIAHDYVGGNDGVYSNAVLGQLNYNPAATAALFGSLTSSNSDAGQIYNPDLSTPAGNNAEFSVSAWVNGSAYTQMQAAGIVAKGNPADEEMSLNEAGSGADFRFDVRSAVGALYAARSTINATNASANNGWHHLVGVCDEANSNVLLYIDGTLAASTTIPALSGITNSSGEPLTIGVRAATATSGNNEQFLGEMSDVAIYGYALTSNQVQTLYEGGALAIPTVSLTGSGSNLTINFTGMLLSSTNVAGPYLPVPGASPPTYLVPMTNSQMFYRANNQ